MNDAYHVTLLKGKKGTEFEIVYDGVPEHLKFICNLFWSKIFENANCLLKI